MMMIVFSHSRGISPGNCRKYINEAFPESTEADKKFRHWLLAVWKGHDAPPPGE